MKLQTQIPLEKQSKNLIDYKSNILLLGSCFVENIGEKLEYFKFQNLQNPFGILFHPKAIETLITNATDGKVYSENDIFFHNEQWHCFDAHSKLSAVLKENLLNTLNVQIKSMHQQICESTHIIITLGTAWAYSIKKSNKIVANCHKVPQSQFEKKLIPVKTICNSLETMVSTIRKTNKKTNIIFTISPVRHIKDGFVENTQSKSHLITAVHQFLKRNGSQNEVEAYFPSYEIMMDELRDYRFYNEDMIHPNKTALSYIWEAFKKVWVSKKAFKTMGEIDAIQKGIQHKPFNPTSNAHLTFLQKLENKKSFIKIKHPYIVF